jgi:hypothetical protein
MVRAMDAMRPWQAFGTPPTTSTHDARRWLRIVLLALTGTATFLILLGAAT